MYRDKKSGRGVFKTGRIDERKKTKKDERGKEK